MQTPSLNNVVETVTGKSGLCELTSRQIKIAVLIAQGFTDQKIAEVLKCSTATVRNEINQITSKLGATSRTNIAYFIGLRHGIERRLKDQARNRSLPLAESERRSTWLES